MQCLAEHWWVGERDRVSEPCVLRVAVLSAPLSPQESGKVPLVFDFSLREMCDASCV